MSDYLERLKIIIQAKLGFSQAQELFVNALAEVPESTLKTFFDVFEKNPELVEKFVNIYQKKLGARASQDPTAWERILEEEIALIGQYNNGV